MDVEFEGVTYTLAEETTGQDYLDLQEIIYNASEPVKVDMRRYGYLNLVKRLRGWTGHKGEVTEEDIKALPSSHYQVLNTTALRLDTAEQKKANDFLTASLDSLEREELQSTLDSLQEPTPAGSEQSSS